VGESTAAVSDVVLEMLGASWLAMGNAATLDEIERAALTGLFSLTDVDIAYNARREDGSWTISNQIGLRGDVQGFSFPDVEVPYAKNLDLGQPICFDDTGEIGDGLAEALKALGLGALYGVPVMRGDRCVAALAIGSRNSHLFSERDRALVRLFTLHMSVLIRKRELAAAFENLAQQVPVIVFRADPSGWADWYNRRWFEYTGQTPEEAAGWGWQTAYHPIDFQTVIVEWSHALKTGQPIEIEFRLRRYDGVFRWHIARVEPLRNDSGTIVDWYGTLIDVEEQKQALEKTKRIAETLQIAFLPRNLPQRANLRVDAHYASAEKDSLLGGDWYDAFELPSGNLCFSIGDVAGHGLAASLAVGKLRQAIFSAALRLDDPASILFEVNEILCLQQPGVFVTALVGIVNLASGNVRYASAGHPPPLVAYEADTSATVLQNGGLPLGVIHDLMLSTHTFPIREGMVVALYTDGVTEYARDAIEGEKKLCEAISVLVGNVAITQPAKIIFDKVLGSKPHADDAALLLLQFCIHDTSLPAVFFAQTKHWRFHASDAHAAHVMRREVGEYLRRLCGDNEGAFTCEVIIGELLANTVEHAPGLVHMAIEWNGRHPVLVVRDNGPGLKRKVATLPYQMSEDGRGLFLVETLSVGMTIIEALDGGAELRIDLPIVGSLSEWD
jgi:PAS domain S-box-containing protein